MDALRNEIDERDKAIAQKDHELEDATLKLKDIAEGCDRREAWREGRVAEREPV